MKIVDFFRPKMKHFLTDNNLIKPLDCVLVLCSNGKLFSHILQIEKKGFLDARLKRMIDVFNQF